METRCWPSGPATHKGVTDHCTVSCISAIYLETSGNLVKALIIGSGGFSTRVHPLSWICTFLRCQARELWHLLASFFHPTPPPASEATSPLGFAPLLAESGAWAVSWIWKSSHRLLWNSFFLRTSSGHYLTCPLSMSPEHWLAVSSQIYRLWGWRQPETGNDSQGHPVKLCIEILPYFLNPNPKMSSEDLTNRGCKSQNDQWHRADGMHLSAAFSVTLYLAWNCVRHHWTYAYICT